MTYAAEPYVHFVDDLLLALTGGVVRERFVFLPEDQPFELNPPGPVLPSSVRVYGQAGSEWRRFVPDRDYTLVAGRTVEFLAGADGVAAAGAVWPDAATALYVNYDHQGPTGPSPRLTDRNPGSVVRLFAETFAREYAVLSRQLFAVYEGAYLDTASGRDLDQVVALVGVARRDRTFATGTVVFSRSSPAQADVFVPAGTRLSSAVPPAAVFETTEDRSLRRGTLSVEAPIQATVVGRDGVVPADTVTVIHQPILGIQRAGNPQATALAGATETDAALRERARSALEGSGQATPGAIVSAVSTVPGIRGKDVLIDEDHLLRPGVIIAHVGVALDDDDCRRAVEAIERVRPAGVRVLHNLDCPAILQANDAGANERPDDVTLSPPASPPDGPNDSLFAPVYVRAVLLPASASLTPEERVNLARTGEEVVRDFVEAAGIGETLIYNRLVAELMGIDGVLDVALELRPAGDPSAAALRNFVPPTTLRPSVAADEGGTAVAEVAAALIALDVEVGVTTSGALAPALAPDQTGVREGIRRVIAGELRQGVATLDTITPGNLRGLLSQSDHYELDAPTYTVEYIEASVRIDEADATIAVGALERAWIRSVSLAPVP